MTSSLGQSAFEGISLKLWLQVRIYVYVSKVNERFHQWRCRFREGLIPVFLGTPNILRKISEIRRGEPGVHRSLGKQRPFIYIQMHLFGYLGRRAPAATFQGLLQS